MFEYLLVLRGGICLAHYRQQRRSTGQWRSTLKKSSMAVSVDLFNCSTQVWNLINQPINKSPQSRKANDQENIIIKLWGNSVISSPISPPSLQEYKLYHHQAFQTFLAHFCTYFYKPCLFPTGDHYDSWFTRSMLQDGVVRRLSHGHNPASIVGHVKALKWFEQLFLQKKIQKLLF